MLNLLLFVEHESLNVKSTNVDGPLLCEFGNKEDSLFVLVKANSSVAQFVFSFLKNSNINDYVIFL